MKINLAIIGATGLVGSTFLKVLEEKQHIEIEKLYLYASKKSAGKTIVFRGEKHIVIELCEKNILRKKIDYALFSAGGKISLEYAPIFKKNGAVVIDNSSAWRMFESVPLVVPEVNPSDAFLHQGIIANPNCSTIQCMLPLKALHDVYGLKRVNYVTFQAVSGSGIKGISDLRRGERGEMPEFYPHAIYNNCLPQIDCFCENGFTKEEMKMVHETQKILHIKSLPVNATCVRVPIENCHSIDICAEFKHEFNIKEVREVLKSFPNIIVKDNPEKSEYPLATEVSGTDLVYVGRIRKGMSGFKQLCLFCVADNIRKGAASNAVQILELLIASRDV